MNVRAGTPVVLRTLVLALVPQLAVEARAQEAQGFSSSEVQALYGWTFQQPDVAEDVPKNVFTFQNTAAGRWWSSFLFVDVLRSWSDADSNAKEVYGEWFPSVSLLAITGKPRQAGLVRDVSATIGLNTGTSSTGSSPFVVLPGATVDLDVPGFAFLSVGAYAYVDRGRFRGRPASCNATTYQLTQSWSLPFELGQVPLRLDGFIDVVGAHADCELQVISQPQLKADVSSLWGAPGRLYVGAELDFWHNKYGVDGVQDEVLLPFLIWVL
jgi:nucleoside-specific outer membrane channel protein Tsx